MKLVFLVLFSIQIYYSFIFILPLKVYKELDSSLRTFLSDRVGLNMKKTKVAWEEVCVPKEEGGLELIRSKERKKDVMLKHLWNLLQCKNRSFWVDWIHSQRLKKKSL